MAPHQYSEDSISSVKSYGQALEPNYCFLVSCMVVVMHMAIASTSHLHIIIIKLPVRLTRNAWQSPACTHPPAKTQELLDKRLPTFSDVKASSVLL